MRVREQYRIADLFFFFSSRRRHTRLQGDWSSDVCSSDLANFLQSIPGPLLDRLETVNFAGYTEREKLEIAKRYLVARQLSENGLTAEQFAVTDRKSVVEGKRVDLGGRRIIKKKKKGKRVELCGA